MLTSRATLLFVLSILCPGAALGAQEAKPKKAHGDLTEAEFAALHELRAGKPQGLRGVELKVGGAKAYLSLPKHGKPTAAILVIHEWWGLNAHIKHWSDRLAAKGYAALAIDLYGGVVATTRKGAAAAMRGVDAEQARKTLLAAHAFLKNDKRVHAKKRACIGWCFGGGMSLNLALAAPDLDAAVIYYGRLVTDPKRLAGIKAPILGIFGNKDRGIPPRSVDAFAAAMKKAGKKLLVKRYDANHAFANPSSARYDQANASKAWAEVQAFLAQHLGGGEPVAEGTVTVGGVELSYAAPKRWKQGRGGSMRALTLTTPSGKSECYLVQLRGGGGGDFANINRWQGQMGQAELSEKEFAALPRWRVLGKRAAFAQIAGSYTSLGKQLDKATMFGVIVPMAGATLYVKMVGPTAEMAKELPAFKAFCESLK